MKMNTSNATSTSILTIIAVISVAVISRFTVKQKTRRYIATTTRYTQYTSQSGNTDNEQSSLSVKQESEGTDMKTRLKDIIRRTRRVVLTCGAVMLLAGAIAQPSMTAYAAGGPGQTQQTQVQATQSPRWEGSGDV